MILTIPGELVSLNEYINAERTNRFIGAKIKKEQTELVAWHVKGKGKVDKYPVRISFRWYTKDTRKDPDNVCAAKKFLLDGLVMAGVLENDTRKHIAGFSDEFYVDKEDTRVEIEII